MMTIRMAHGDYSKVTGARQDADDLLVGSWSVVLAPTQITLPAVTQPLASVPAAWSLRLPLDTPFNYDGVNALYFEIATWDTQNIESVSFDAIDYSKVTVEGTPFGAPGCTVKGVEATARSYLTVYADGRPSDLYFEARPALQSGFSPTAFMWIGAQPTNMPTGLCAPALVTPQALVELPSMFGPLTGYTFRPEGHSGNVSLQHNASLIGLELYGQAWVTDGRTVFGTRGVTIGKYPAPPVATREVAGQFVALFGAMDQFLSQVTLTQESALIVGLEQ